MGRSMGNRNGAVDGRRFLALAVCLMAALAVITGILIFAGVLALIMAVFRFAYAWDMKRDPVGIYSHYQMRLKARIVFLVLGLGGGTLIAIFDILTRKYVVENRESLIHIVNNHFAKA